MQGSFSEPKKTTSFQLELAGTYIFKQAYMNHRAALVALIISLVQTGCLLFDNSLLIYPQQSGLLYTFLVSVNKLILGRDQIDMVNPKAFDIVLKIFLGLYILLIIVSLSGLVFSLKRRSSLPKVLRK
jgi:hypothetical protein